MTKYTHILSGVVLGKLAADNLILPQSNAITLPIIYSCALAGAIFPDVDLRFPFVRHRTITHWFPVYLAGLVIALAASPGLQVFFLGCLVHIALDMLTPMGVPIIAPIGNRFSLKLFKTGGLEEGLVLAGLVVLISVLTSLPCF